MLCSLKLAKTTMRSLGELGIGLSVVFCVFVLALVGELCYIFYWKKSGFVKSTSTDCLKSTAEINAGKKLHRSSAEFVREASSVGSFGGYPVCIPTEVGGGSDASLFGGSFCSSLDQPPHLLFPIKEETKEDLELAADSGGTTKPHSRLRSRTPSDVLTIHFTSGSSSPAASVDTPFMTPPSSPPATESVAAMAKLSPFVACAVRPMSCGKSSSPVSEMYVLSGCWPASPADNRGRERMPLRLLFERSPLLGPRPQSPAAIVPSPSQPTYLHTSLGASGSSDTLQAPVRHHFSLSALFGQSSSPCLPVSSTHLSS
eukprot:c14659_g1_i1 orf=468-1412(-)